MSTYTVNRNESLLLVLGRQLKSFMFHFIMEIAYTVMQKTNKYCVLHNLRLPCCLPTIMINKNSLAG